MVSDSVPIDVCTESATGLQGEQSLMHRIMWCKGSRQNRFVTSGKELALRVGPVLV